jgi:hypothetical protein
VTTRSITLFDPDEPAGVRALPRDDDPLTWDNAEKRGSAGVVPLATREEFQEIFTLSDPDRSRDSRTPAVDELDEIGLL